MPEAHTQQPDSTPAANPLRDAITEAIEENRVILFMKGTPDQPACGFSARTVGCLQSLGTPFAAVNVLGDPRIRQELSALSEWPTIPQLFIGGELVGGCDIVTEMFESGELADALGLERDRDAAAPATTDPPTAPPQTAPPATASPQAGPAPLQPENRL